MLNAAGEKAQTIGKVRYLGSYLKFAVSLVAAGGSLDTFLIGSGTSKK